MFEGQRFAILAMFCSGGGLAGGRAAGTEQCQQHCRPYKVPSGTIGYSPGTLSHYPTDPKGNIGKKNLNFYFDTIWRKLVCKS